MTYRAIDSTSATIVDEMGRLRRGELSLRVLKAVRDEILHDTVLRRLVPDRIADQLASANDRISLFHALFAFWGYNLAKAPSIKKEQPEIYQALISDDTKDIVAGYHAVVDGRSGKRVIGADSLA